MGHHSYIALFRGINVGGRNILPMRALTELLEALNALNVKTYIQSGNAVFQHNTADIEGLSGSIRTAIYDRFGFEPHVLLLTMDDLAQAIADNPFPNAEHSALHLFFLNDVPRDPDLTMLEGIRRARERFELKNRVLYLNALDGIGRSRLAARVETALGVIVTGRNWRSVSRIMSLANKMEGDV